MINWSWYHTCIISVSRNVLKECWLMLNFDRTRCSASWLNHILPVIAKHCVSLTWKWNFIMYPSPFSHMLEHWNWILVILGRNVPWILRRLKTIQILRQKLDQRSTEKCMSMIRWDSLFYSFCKWVDITSFSTIRVRSYPTSRLRSGLTRT